MKKRLRYDCQHGTLYYYPIDMDGYRKVADEYDQDNPKPEAPLRDYTQKDLTHVEYLQVSKLARERKISFRQAEELVLAGLGQIEDESDAEYLKQIESWSAKKFLALSKYVMSNSVIFDLPDYGEFTIDEAKKLGIYPELIASWSFIVFTRANKEIDLYQTIIYNSELSWQSVIQAATEIGYQRHGEFILDKIPKNSGGEAQPIRAVLSNAASHFHKTLSEVEAWPISQQALLVAQYVSIKWLEYFAYEDAKAKAKK